MRADEAAEDFSFARLLYPLTAIVAATRGMSIEHHAIDAVEDVFLQVLGGIEGGVAGDVSLAQRTAARSQHVDMPIVFTRRGAEPTGMTNRSSAFLLLLAGRGFVGSVIRRDVGVRTVLLLLVCGKLVLPFQFQFQLGLFQFPLQALVFFDEPGVPTSFGIQCSVQIIERITCAIGGVDERTERGTPQMWAMSDVRAAIFVIGIKTEIHRQPSLNVESLDQKPTAS